MQPTISLAETKKGVCSVLHLNDRCSLHVAVVRYPVPSHARRDESHRAQEGEGEVVVDWEPVVAVDRVGEQRPGHDGGERLR